MRIIRWDLLTSEESTKFLDTILDKSSGSAITIGGFDGPHIGHDRLFDSVLEASRHMGLVPGIVTFNRSPGAEKRPDEYPGDVSTLNLRLSRFAEKGFKFAVLIDFSGDFGKMTGSVFFDILVKTVHMRYVAVGPDFRCGHRLDTGVAEISALSRIEGFRFDSIRQVEFEGLRISSSAVRASIQQADFTLAERLLGHPFLLDFTVPEWSVSDFGYEADIRSFTQILPRRGTYDVVLHVDSGKPVSAVTDISDDIVLVRPNPGQALPNTSRITAIRFGLS